MIFFYYSNKQPSYANAILAMIVTNMIMQLFVVFLLYLGDKKAMKRELIYTLMLLKGGRVQLQGKPVHLTSFSQLSLFVSYSLPVLFQNFKVLKGEDTQGCALESTQEMILFETQEVRQLLSLSALSPSSNVCILLILFFFKTDGV
jgi:hypothetical protein